MAATANILDKHVKKSVKQNLWNNLCPSDHIHDESVGKPLFINLEILNSMRSSNQH